MCQNKMKRNHIPSIFDWWIDNIGWKWTDGLMVISLTRILWSMIDTIDQKNKSLTDGSILKFIIMTNSIDL
jgi:hypothetical protein